MSTTLLMLLMMIGSTLFVGALVGLTIYFVTKSRNRFIDAAGAALKDIARDVNGTFYEAGDRWKALSTAFQPEKAKKFARLHPGGYYPALGFPFKGGTGLLYFNSTGSQETLTYWTSITLSLNQPFKNSISLSTEATYDRLSKMLGGQDITAGDAPFDKRFVIRGENEEFVRYILNAETRNQITQLADVNGTLFDFHLGGNIVIKSESFMKDREKLRSYILLATELGNILT
jgi:hypothetical protein